MCSLVLFAWFFYFGDFLLRYNLELIKVDGSIQSALSRLQETRPSIKAVLMGTRYSDPYSGTKPKQFEPLCTMRGGEGSGGHLSTTGCLVTEADLYSQTVVETLESVSRLTRCDHGGHADYSVTCVNGHLS